MTNENVRSSFICFFTVAFFAHLLFLAPVRAQKSYDPGVTDTEIKIGNIMPYTGAEQAYGAVGRAEAAYFQMINDRGGINGRKINFISVNDASQSTQAPALARKLVEEDRVFLLFSSMGTESNLLIRPYMNEMKVPQIFLESSSAVFDDPLRYSWTMGFFATYRTEGIVYAKYILQTKLDAKIAILYRADDPGREYLAGIHEGLGAKSAVMIVKELSYDLPGDQLDSQIQQLKNSGADVFLNLSIGPMATRIIRAAFDAGWHPLQFIPNASLSVAAFLDPAGLEKSAGIISNARSKGWLRTQDQDDPAVRDFLDWMKKYNPQASLRDQNNVAGYERAEALVEVLRRCRDNLTRENVMKQAANLDLELPMLRPGIRVKTSPKDFQPIKQLFLIHFDGHAWQPQSGVFPN